MHLHWLHLIRQQRHSQLNDIIWRALKRAQIPAAKEPVSLVKDDNKRPDGTTLLPWARSKPMAWDVTVPDTYAKSHISSTVVKAGAAAHRAAQSKTDKYASLASTHIFCPSRFRTLDESIINVFTDVWFGIRTSNGSKWRKSIPLADNKHCYVVVVVYLWVNENDISAILTGFWWYKFQK